MKTMSAFQGFGVVMGLLAVGCMPYQNEAPLQIGSFPPLSSVPERVEPWKKEDIARRQEILEQEARALEERARALKAQNSPS